MKRMFLASLLVCATLMMGCKSSTQYGECVGFLSDEDRSPDLQYSWSGRNLFWTIVFSETLVVPIVYAVGYSHCPVGNKSKKEAK